MDFKAILMQVLVWLAESFDILILIGGSYFCFYEAVKYHKNGFLKDSHLMYFLTFSTFSFFFKLLLPIAYYKEDLNDAKSCAVFFIDSVPQSFTVFAICVLIMKLFNLMRAANATKQHHAQSWRNRNKLQYNVLNCFILFIVIAFTVRLLDSCFEDKIQWNNTFIIIHLVVFIVVEFVFLIMLVLTLVVCLRPSQQNIVRVESLIQFKVSLITYVTANCVTTTIKILIYIFQLTGVIQATALSYTLIYIFDILLLGIMGYTALFLHNVQRQMFHDEEENEEFANPDDNYDDIKLITLGEKILKRAQQMRKLMNVQQEPNDFIKVRQTQKRQRQQKRMRVNQAKQRSKSQQYLNSTGNEEEEDDEEEIMEYDDLEEEEEEEEIALDKEDPDKVE